jgi:hypothetical protein
VVCHGCVLVCPAYMDNTSFDVYWVYMMTAKKTKTIRVSKERWVELMERKIEVFQGGSMDHLIKYLLDVEKVAKT